MHSSQQITITQRLTLLVSIASLLLVANVSAIRQNKLASASNDFGFLLYKAIGESNSGRNVFFSPASISVGLGMVHAGAGGDTKTQLTSVMGLSGFPEDSVNEEFRNLIDTLKAPGNNHTLLVANRLFGQAGYDFRREFLEVTNDFYRASLEALDFAGEPGASRVQINDWVAKVTADKIRDLLPDGSIDASTILVLVNAIYFKGNWSNPFDVGSTKQRTFHQTKKMLTSMEMMSMDTRDLEYFESAKLQSAVLELPYVGGQASMLVFRPNDVEGLGWLEERLNASTLGEVFEGLHTEKVTVTLPKFVLEQGVALKQFFQSIGIIDLFDQSKADLSPIDGTKRLVITEIMHKAYVAVDEAGTEAAAATGSIVKVKSAGPRSIDFVVDRPFLFLIADRTTGSVLFLGRLTQAPRKGDGDIGEFGRTAELRQGSGSGDPRPTVVVMWMSAVVVGLIVWFGGEGLRRLYG